MPGMERERDKNQGTDPERACCAYMPLNQTGCKEDIRLMCPIELSGTWLWLCFSGSVPSSSSLFATKLRTSTLTPRERYATYSFGTFTCTKKHPYKDVHMTPCTHNKLSAYKRFFYAPEFHRCLLSPLLSADGLNLKKTARWMGDYRSGSQPRG